MNTALPDHCLAVAGCERPRHRYRGYCAAHGPATAHSAEPRCNAPLRCYCLRCGEHTRLMLGPYDTPESIRARLDALRARPALRIVSTASPVT